MSRLLLISDLHLGHRSITKFSGTIRGNTTTVSDHNDWIVNQWNSIVGRSDVVKVLGDVCFDKEALDLLSKMKGSKHLLLGNHDHFPLELYAKYFKKIHAFEKHKGIWLSHAPIHPNELRGGYNVHGHVHQNSVPDPKYFNVSVEAINGQPIEFGAIMEQFKQRGLAYPIVKTQSCV